MSAELIAKYAIVPDSLSGITIVRCNHDYHGDVILYIPDDEFQSMLVPAIRSFWVNGYSFVITESNGI